MPLRWTGDRIRVRAGSWADGVLTWQFGPDHAGLAYYLVLEREPQVAILEIQWFAQPPGFPPAVISNAGQR